MKTFIIILTVIILISVIFNQVTYYVTGSLDFDFPEESNNKAFKVITTASMVLTYVSIPISWIVEICCSAADMMDEALPLTCTLLLTGVIMFFSGIACRSDENPYIPGTFLGAISIFVIVLTLIGL